jgi:hypothetical protein
MFFSFFKAYSIQWYHSHAVQSGRTVPLRYYHSIRYNRLNCTVHTGTVTKSRSHLHTHYGFQ